MRPTCIDYINPRGTKYCSSRSEGQCICPKGSIVIDVTRNHGKHLFYHIKKGFKINCHYFLRPRYRIYEFSLAQGPKYLPSLDRRPCYDSKPPHCVSVVYFPWLIAFYDVILFWMMQMFIYVTVNDLTNQKQLLFWNGENILSVMILVVNINKNWSINIFGQAYYFLIDYLFSI